LSARFEPVDQLALVEEANKLLGAVARGKLEVIMDQIQYLQNQAKILIEKAERNLALHGVNCLFQRRVGMTYHLYVRDDGNPYFSMLSPEDWGWETPHLFQGSFRLEEDMTWTEIKD
jgi:hypothetical protein